MAGLALRGRLFLDPYITVLTGHTNPLSGWIFSEFSATFRYRANTLPLVHVFIAFVVYKTGISDYTFAKFYLKDSVLARRAWMKIK